MSLTTRDGSRATTPESTAQAKYRLMLTRWRLIVAARKPRTVWRYEDGLEIRAVHRDRWRADRRRRKWARLTAIAKPEREAALARPPGCTKRTCVLTAVGAWPKLKAFARLIENQEFEPGLSR